MQHTRSFWFVNYALLFKKLCILPRSWSIFSSFIHRRIWVIRLEIGIQIKRNPWISAFLPGTCLLLYFGVRKGRAHSRYWIDTVKRSLQAGLMPWRGGNNKYVLKREETGKLCKERNTNETNIKLCITAIFYRTYFSLLFWNSLSLSIYIYIHNIQDSDASNIQSFEIIRGAILLQLPTFQFMWKKKIIYIYYN